MNHHGPRQVRLEDGSPGGWHYTCHNRRVGTYPEGYCTGHEPHETEQQARECYALWALDNARYDVKLSSQMLRCEIAGCDVWSQIMAGPPGYSAFGRDVVLCDEHRNRAGLESVLGTSAGDCFGSW